MVLTATNMKLVSGGRDGKENDYRLTDILRRRQRPLLLIVEESGELVYSSLPEGVRDNALNAQLNTPTLLQGALTEARRLLRAEHKQLIVDKPGERCIMVVLEEQFFCLRLFGLEGHGIGRRRLHAVLLESIGDPESGGIDLEKVKEVFRLSNREADVVEALLTGGTDKEIARTLGVSVATIRAYLKSVRAKLGVSTRTAIVSLVHGVHNDQLQSRN